MDNIEHQLQNLRTDYARLSERIDDLYSIIKSQQKDIIKLQNGE